MFQVLPLCTPALSALVIHQHTMVSHVLLPPTMLMDTKVHVDVDQRAQTIR